MFRQIPVVPSRRALATASSASAAFLLAGSAEGATHFVPTAITLNGDTDGHVLAIRLTHNGLAATHQTLASQTGFASLAASATNDAIFGINAQYITWMSQFVISATGDHASVVAGSDFASVLYASFGYVDGSLNFRSTMRIADYIAALSYWQLGGILGVKFVPEGGTDAYYGWVWISYISLDASTAIIGGYAWEDTANTGIHPSFAGSSAASAGGASPAGGTPEPSAGGLALLALGAAGVMRHRRKERQ